MSAHEALCLAWENGIRVRVTGADLVLDADREPATAILEALRRHKAEIVTLLSTDHDRWTAEDWQTFFDERAGIAEFDGGQSRDDAECTAFECCVTEWLQQHPCQSDPYHCVACGRPDPEGHSVVPFGSKNDGHIWLHPECWRDWYNARKADAVDALAAMDIGIPAKFPKDFGKNGRG